MEHIISNLLEEFKQGRISRRQLVQGLAPAATAAPVASSASPFKAIAVNHISYQVRDYRKARDFYAGLFGMKSRMITGENAISRLAIRFSSHGITLSKPRVSITSRTRSIIGTGMRWRPN